jgi:hypothetical protein
MKAAECYEFADNLTWENNILFRAWAADCRKPLIIPNYYLWEELIKNRLFSSFYRIFLGDCRQISANLLHQADLPHYRIFSPVWPGYICV